MKCYHFLSCGKEIFVIEAETEDEMKEFEKIARISQELSGILKKGYKKNNFYIELRVKETDS